jgi:hypothetical protein
MCEDFGEWGYEMSSIRIVVKIPTGTYPELVADLNQVAPRERAERLRLLAMIGLRDLHQIEPRVQQQSHPIRPMNEKPTDPKIPAGSTD